VELTIERNGEILDENNRQFMADLQQEQES